MEVVLDFGVGEQFDPFELVDEILVKLFDGSLIAVSEDRGSSIVDGLFLEYV